MDQLCGRSMKGLLSLVVSQQEQAVEQGSISESLMLAHLGMGMASRRLVGSGVWCWPGLLVVENNVRVTASSGHES